MDVLGYDDWIPMTADAYIARINALTTIGEAVAVIQRDPGDEGPTRVVVYVNHVPCLMVVSSDDMQTSETFLRPIINQ